MPGDDGSFEEDSLALGVLLVRIEDAGAVVARVPDVVGQWRRAAVTRAATPRVASTARAGTTKRNWRTALYIVEWAAIAIAGSRKV